MPSTLTRSPPDPATPGQPALRRVEMGRPAQWLALAWHDMARCGWISFFHGLLLALVGAAILAVAHDRFWLMAGALSGFLVVAPVLATSLYALSRALERGEPAGLAVVIGTWTAWQRGRRSMRGQDDWALLQFGALLALAGTGWMVTSAALITLLAPLPVRTPIDFVHHVVLAPQGFLFELWLALGGVLAAPMFASTVVAMPLLLDRRVSLLTAVLTSWRAVLLNPLPLAWWAALIMGFTLLGLASLLLGLVAVVPMLGHASWHAYRDLVDAEGVPLRESG
jgi:uncharacterized membrane protein